MVDVVAFSLLGPVRAWRGGSELALGSPQQRTVLAALLLNNGAQVSVERLVGALWGERPPTSSTSVVRTYITRLRQVLAPAGVAVQTRGGGYALPVAAAQVDVEVFHARVAQARQARTRDDAETAAALLREALGLWSGSALAGLRTPFAEAQRIVLEEARVLAAEECAALDVEQGRHAEAAVALLDLVETYPLRERLSELLMIALYRSGRQAEALDVHRRACTLLRRELGVEPGPGLRRMQQRILDGDPGLLAPSPSGPKRLTGPAADVRDWATAGGTDHTTPSVPPTRLPPYHAASPDQLSQDHAEPVARPEPTVLPAQLPKAPAAFVGRERQLAQLDELVAENDDPNRSVTVMAIDGSAGVGKTSLAVHWAHRVAHRFPDGQLYADLNGFSSERARCPSRIQQTFLYALGIRPAPLPETPDEWTGLYRSAFAGRRMLIVLDNARQAEQVRPLLPGAPGCRTVVTGRMRMPALVAAEGALPLTLCPLNAAAAAETVIRRLGPEWSAADDGPLGEIVELCGRLPLALAMVAARARAHPNFPLAAIARELRAAHGGLDAFAGDGDTDLRAAFSWSYRQLGADAGRMFRLLSVCRTPDITQAVAASLAGIDRRRAHAALAELSRAHMVKELAPGRYVLPKLLRAYAQELYEEHDAGEGRVSATSRLLDHQHRSAHAATSD